MSMRFTLDITAWDAGFDAGEAGLSFDSCPYPVASKEALSWHAGFIDGKAARLNANAQLKASRPDASVRP